ncbi:MAG: ubiquitin-like protein Pup [Cellulomonadaceae bacterium]
MSGQERVRRPHDGEPDDDAGQVHAARPQDDEVDALLEEIDEVLETNAESFVRGFVQKGGE